MIDNEAYLDRVLDLPEILWQLFHGDDETETVFNRRLDFLQNKADANSQLNFDSTKLLFNKASKLASYKRSRKAPENEYIVNMFDILETAHQETGIWSIKPKESYSNDVQSELYDFYLKLTTQIFEDLNCLTYGSDNFGVKVNEVKRHKIFLDYLKDENLLSYYLETHRHDLGYFYQVILGSIICVAKVSANYINQWKDNDAVKILLNFFNKTKDNNEFRIYTAMAIAFIASDSEFQSIPEIKEAMPEIIKLIAQCSNKIKAGEDLYRNEFEIEPNKVVSVCCAYSEGSQWNLINLLKAIYHVAINDQIKNELYFIHNLKEYLRDIIRNGNSTEISHSLKVLLQLSFDPLVSKDIQSDKSFFSSIQSKRDESELIFKICDGILWNSNKNNSNTEIPSNFKSS